MSLRANLAYSDSLSQLRLPLINSGSHNTAQLSRAIVEEIFTRDGITSRFDSCLERRLYENCPQAL